MDNTTKRNHGSRNNAWNVILNLHSTCIGLHMNEVNFKTYIQVLLRHLMGLVKSPLAKPVFRRRAEILLVSLILSSLSLFSVGTYITVKVIMKMKSLLNRSLSGSKNKPLLRRTRSRVLLESGGRVMYIPDDKSMLSDIGGNATVLNDSQEQKFKKIYLPIKDNDQYEHDKFFFKQVENERKKPYNKLFYSKFLSQMNVLSKILMPTIFHKNSVLLSLQIVFLVMRTWLSLFVARLDGQIVRDIIAGRGRKFLQDLAIWFLIAIPASYTNSAIKFLQRKLSLNFRVNLTRYIHDMYMDKRLAFYKLMFDSKAGSSVIKNIDNSITNDVTRFCDATCSVFANIAKPVIDLVFFSVYLRDNLGSFGVVGIFINYFITGYILRMYTPPLGKLSSASSAADGNYYNYHLNMINNNEEISFYQGTEVERMKIRELYDILMTRMLDISKKKFGYTMMEDYILKYTWSGLGYVFASIPIVLTTLKSGVNSEQRNMKDFIVNKRLMLSLADAGSRLMHSIKDISQLTGYTNRIFTLLCALHRVHSVSFNYGAKINDDALLEISNIIEQKSKQQNKKLTMEKEEIIRGTIQRNFNGIRLENIDVVIPSIRANKGVKLIKKLTFQIPQHIEPLSSKINSVQELAEINDITIPLLNSQGSSLLILGPNSCGKSSIQRVIAEIWPIYNKNGLLSKPDEKNLLCIPQKPYFTRGGTLRDQIVYPMSSDEFFDNGLKDKLLVQVLTEVKLEYLLKRGNGWNYLDEVADWKDVLSGGEKQRMNFARILFHKPRYIVLDEATNAISADMEDYLFNLLKKYRFNFITISQRPSLIRYHDILLEIATDEDDKGWQLQTLGTDEAITSLEHEIDGLEKKLANVKKWELEREELQQKLAVI